MNMNIKPAKGIVRCQAGFTIIELLIAVVIFSIGFMAVGGLQFGSMLKVRQSTDKTIAMEAIQEQVEVLQRIPLFMNTVWDHDAIDHDSLYGVEFDLSEAFRETVDEPDHTVTIGNFDVFWSVDDPVLIPDRWIDDTHFVPAAVPVMVTVCRTGDDPVADSLMSVQFVKYWVTDD